MTQLDSDPSAQEDAQRLDPDHDSQHAGDGGTGFPGNLLPTPPVAIVPVPATREQDNPALVQDSREQDGSAAEIQLPAIREEDNPDPVLDPRERDGRRDGTTPEAAATPDATPVHHNRNADRHVQVPINRERGSVWDSAVPVPDISLTQPWGPALAEAANLTQQARTSCGTKRKGTMAQGWRFSVQKKGGPKAKCLECAVTFNINETRTSPMSAAGKTGLYRHIACTDLPPDVWDVTGLENLADAAASEPKQALLTHYVRNTATGMAYWMQAHPQSKHHTT